MDKPFVGLVPFAETDAAYFFGRQSERRVLVDNLLASRLTLLYGESGAGKSSLLNAGVAFELRAEPEFAVVVFRNWRDEPLAALAEAIQKTTGCAASLPANSGLAEIIKSCASGNRTLLIILDQFEEYFHYHPANGAFDSELARTLTRRELPANFLISVREDWLAALDRFKGQIPGLFDNYLRMQHLSPEGAAEAIEGPLRRFNDEQKNGDRVSWDPNLTQRVIESILSTQMTAERGLQPGDRVQAPYLQMVMSSLWQREMELGSHQLRVATLDDDLKGVRHIYESHLSNTLSKELSDEERGAALEMFRFLVTGGGRKQNLTIHELCGGTGFSETLVRNTVTKLKNAMVLTQTPPPRGAPADQRGYEFAHDVLAEAALKYVRQQAVEAERRKTEEAEQRAAVEAKTTKRLRFLLGALVVSLVCVIAAVGAVTVALLESRKLKAEQRNAVEQKELAQSAAARAEQSKALALAQELVQSANEASSHYNFDLAVLLASYALQGARVSGSVGLVADAEAALRTALTAVDAAPLPGTFDDIISDIAWSPDGTRLATADTKTFQLWNLQTGKRILKDENTAVSVAWSPDGKWLAEAATKRISLRDGSSGKVLATADDGRAPLTWRPKLPQFASSSPDNGVLIWQAPGLKKIAAWPVGDKSIDALSWSPDGTRIAAASEDLMLRVWNASSKRKVLNMKAYARLTTMLDENDTETTMPFVGWSPEGNRLLTTDMFRPLEVRDAKTGNVLHTVQTPLVSMTMAAWSHNGKWLALDSLMQQSFKILDGDATHLYVEVPSAESLAVIRWDPKDDRMAISSLNKKLWIYHTDALRAQTSDDLLALARAKVKRPLTSAECKQYLHMDSCPARP